MKFLESSICFRPNGRPRSDELSQMSAHLQQSFRIGTPIWVQMIDMTFVFYDRSRDVTMAISFWAKSAKLAYLTFIRRTDIPKRIGISQRRRAR